VQQLPLKIQWPSYQRFDTFITGENRVSVDLLRRVAQNDSYSSPLFVSGPASCGKTHLLLAVCSTANERQISAQYFRLGALGEDHEKAIRKFGGSKLLCLDDIDVIAGNFSAEHALFDLYNRCRAENTTLLFSAKNAPLHSGFVLPDLVSRLSSCTLAPIKPLSDTARRGAFYERATARGIDLDDAVLDFLFALYKCDVGSFFRLLEKNDNLSLAEKRRITIPFLKKVENDQKSLS